MNDEFCSSADLQFVVSYMPYFTFSF